MGNNCLPYKNKDVISLAKATGLDPVVAAAKIGTLMDLFADGHFPVEEEFKDYLGIANNVDESIQPTLTKTPIENVEEVKEGVGYVFKIEQDGNNVYEYLGDPYTIKKEEFKQFSEEDILKFVEQLPVEKFGTSRLRSNIEDLVGNYTYNKLLTVLDTLKNNYNIEIKEINDIIGTLKSSSDELKKLNMILPQNHIDAARYIELFGYYNNAVKYILDIVATKFDINKIELTGYGKNDVYIPNRIIHYNTIVENVSLTINSQKLVSNNIELKAIEQVAKEIVHIKEITITNELDRLYRPEMRIDRVNLVAREFSNTVDAIQKQLRPNSTRQEIIDEYGISAIYEETKDYFIEQSQNADTFTEYLMGELQKIVDNFDLLIRETPRILADHEAVDIKFMNGQLQTIKPNKDEDIPESLTDDIDGVELTNDDEEPVKDGWMIKHKFIDPLQALSQLTRKILMEIPKLDFKGREDLDDLDMPRYLDSEVSHGVLIEQLSGMTKSSQMIPILNRLAKTKPWVNSIVKALEDNQLLHSIFYQDFRKVFMSYWVQIRKKMADGSYTYMTKELNKPDGVAYFLDEWRAIMESKTLLSFNSVYDDAGNIDRDNLATLKLTLVGLKETDDLPKIDGMVDDIKGKSIEEITKYVNNNIGKIKDILGALGVDTDITSLLEALQYIPKSPNVPGMTMTINHMFTKMLDNLVRITNGLDRSKATHLDFINAYAADYKGIAEILLRSNTLLMRSSVYENLKSYYSFTAPSYMADLMNKLKGTEYSDEELKEFFAKEYELYNWFYQNGKYRNAWLRDLATDAKSRELFSHKVVLNYNKKEYSKLSALDHTIMMINEYSNTIDTTNKVAWFPQFILADAPSAEFVRFHKYNDLTSKNWEESLLDGFYDVAMLEYDRIKMVRNRQNQIAKGLIAPIDNFETKGLEFQFLPFLDKYIKEFDTYQESIDLKSVMPDTVEKFTKFLKDTIKVETDLLYELEKKRYRKIGLFKMTDDGKTLKHLLNLSSVENAEKELRNYFWNQRFAQSQMLQITTTDLAYYKNLGDVLKRMKQIHTPGLRLDTLSEHGRTIENTIFLKDFKSVSNTLADIKEALDAFVKKGTMTAKDRDLILEKYSTNDKNENQVEVTDAQAYRSLSSYRAIMDMSGQWTPEMQRVFDKLKKMQKGEDVKFDANDFNTIWQPKKPFVYTQIANQGLVKDEATGINKELLLRTPIQNKNAEFLLIFSNILKKSPLLSAIEEFMEENQIDVVLFSSAVKVGGLGALDVHEFTTKEAIKGYLLESISSNVGRYNPLIVHSIPYDDYALVQPVPSHYMDTTQGFGTLIRKLILSDLNPNLIYKVNGKDYTKDLITLIYAALNVENLLGSFYRTVDSLRDKQAVNDTLKKEVNGSKRYSPEMAKALELAEDGFPTLPYSDLIHSDRTSSLLHSGIKNEITKLKTKGGSLVHVTSWGVHDDLNIKWATNDNGEKYIEYIECYMPWYSSEYFEALMDPKTGLLDVDAVHKNLKDKNGNPLKVLPDELRKLIGYRIPTENKYSMFPLYIKGFLPGNSGSAIMMPKEVTTIAGLDFDVDKLYAMFLEFNTIKKYDRNKFVTELMLQMGVDPKENRELFKTIKNLTYKENADKLDKESNEYKVFENWLESRDLKDENGESKYFLGEIIEKVKFEETPTLNHYITYIKYVTELKDINADNVKLIAEEKGLQSWEEFKKAALENPSLINSLKARNNQIIDIMWGILTNPDTVLNMINPGAFDGLKKSARVVTINKGLKLAEYREFEAIAIEKGFFKVIDEKEVANVPKYLNSLGLETLNQMAEKYKEKLDPLSPSTQTYFHKLNHTAGALIGIFANHNANHAVIQGTKLAVKKEFGVKIGGELYLSLHEIFNKHRLYISRNTSEPVAASVDAVKDPVLSDLNLNGFTADLASLLLRLGHTHGTVGLFLSLPIVIEMTNTYELLSDSGISKRDAIKKTIEEFFGKTYKTDYTTTELDYTNSDLSQSDMATAIVYGNAIANGEELTPAEHKLYYVFQLKIANAFKTSYSTGLVLSRVVSSMRSDTSGGSTGPGQADTDLKIDDVTDLMEETDSKNFPLEGAKLIKVDILKDRSLSKKENIARLRDTINESTLPMVLANYTLGLETSELLLSQYYPYAKESFRQVIKAIKNLTKTFEFSKGSLTAKLVKLIYNDLFVYITSELEFFGGKTAQEAQVKRDYYINKFPDEFEKLKTSNKEIGELVLILGLKVRTDDKGKKIIKFSNVGSLSPNLKDSVTRDWDSLLSMGDEAKKLATDLLAYSYFRNGFAFGPTSFIHLAPVNVRLAIPNYRRTLIKLNLMKEDKHAYDRFVNQFLMNHRNLRKFVPEMNEIDDSVFINGNKELNEAIQILTPVDESRNGQIMIRKGISFPIIMKKLNGVEYYYSKYGDTELLGSDTYITLYSLIENPIGIPNKFLEYQNGLNMEDMESLIDPKYKGYEEDDVEGPETMPMEGFEDVTPPAPHIGESTTSSFLRLKMDEIKKEVNNSTHEPTDENGQTFCKK